MGQGGGEGPRPRELQAECWAAFTGVLTLARLGVLPGLSLGFTEALQE